MRYVKLVFGAVLISAFFSVPVSALTYTRDVDVQFTFVSNLSVSIDSADIEILDLTPGQQKDSNVINISVSTNSIAGYTVSATTGNSSTYNTTNMVHTNGTNTFTSLAENASESTLSTDNTWGYAVSPEVESWTTFSGLPIYTDTAKEIAKTDGPSTDITKFKIHAKAAADQPAGDYRNVINFTVVANTPPRTIGDVLDENPNTPRDPETQLPIIQSITEDVCDAVEAIGESTLVSDIRDHTIYHVAKLADNRCWLQDNLALDPTQPTVQANLTEATTNASAAAISNYINGGNPDNNTWWSSYAVADMNGTYDQPIVHAGDKDVVPQDSNDPLASVSAAGGWKAGVYYNYCAASVGTYCAESSDGYNATTAIYVTNDVCPANWRMPTGGVPSPANLAMNGAEFYKLFINYTSGSESPYNLLRYALRIPLAGYHFNGNINYDIVKFWSTTFNSSHSMYVLYMDWLGNSTLNIASSEDLYEEITIRCIVKESPKYTITYDANGGSGSMPSQEAKAGKTIKLTKNQFTRSGYKFMGWNTASNGTGVGYGDKDDYTGSSAITLYAQWAEDTNGQGGGSGYYGRTLQAAYEQAYVYNTGQFPKDEGGYKRGLYVPHKTNGVYDGTYFEATQQSDYDGIPAKDLRFAIQDISLLVDNENVCERTTVIGSEAYVLDLRDYQSYWVAKLPDGRCWLQDNLALDLTMTNASSKITPANTNADTTSLNALFGIATRDASTDPNGNLATLGVADWTSSSSFIKPLMNKASKDMVNSSDEIEAIRTSKYGIYYNYCAASAGSYCYSNNIAPDKPDILIDTEYDICPAGWRLPTTTGSGDYQALFNVYNSNTATYRAALLLSLSGYISGGSAREQGNLGRFWSSTRFTGGSMYILNTSASSAYPSGSNLREYGYSIRCIAK